MNLAPDFLTYDLHGSPEHGRAELAERSLYLFIRHMWPQMDPAPFVDGWHIRVICEHLEAVCRGEIKRLIINIPPRHCKSLLVAVAYPAWCWARRSDDPLSGPATSFLYASYAQNLSTRDSRKCRALIESDLYQKRWGDRFKIISDQNTKTRFETDAMGYRLATSVGGALTGEGASIIILDDPNRADEAESPVKREAVLEWWKLTMSNRLNAPAGGAFIVVQQRLHQDDLSGYLLNKKTEQDDDLGRWERLVLPARYEPQHPRLSVHDIRTSEGALLWPQRFSDAYLRDQETEMGSYGFAGQYQMRPAPRKGGLFELAWWQYVDETPAAGLRVRAWDFAATAGAGSWTVGLLLSCHNGAFYVEDVQRKQLSPHGVRRLVKSLAELDGKHVSISLPNDPGQAGNDQVDSYRKFLVGYDVRSSPESGDKKLRATAHGQAAQVEAGNVKLKRAQWNGPFVEEMAMFPRGHDDQVDAFSRAFGFLVKRINQRAAPALGAPSFEEHSLW
ncbi:MAG: phage terminase large subunit [Caldilineaceae bacterium SB0661_bin_32]|uniref:Phage terminase large subunit n=1 Tax=Caldilineaceae bacterium SB0661_bin_32 TaxID=2605255 RepID=A0A6B1D876_9CHLR|nr:phage terminase large subunit [Caldilineaceae bacterium SB0661_bin_32]